MGYPNLGKDMIIQSLDLPSMMLMLSDDSVWQFQLNPPPPGWTNGDTVVVDLAGAVRKGVDKVYCKVTNKSRKNQEADAIMVVPPPDIKKSLDTNAPEEEYANHGEAEIREISDEFIWLRDCSKWSWYSPTLLPGLWEAGNKVIFTNAFPEKIKSKSYKMVNIKTEKFLIVTFMGYEEPPSLF